MGLLADLLAIKKTLPPADPIAPEHRGVSRLYPHDAIPRGQVYRVNGEAQPLILMNADDAKDLRSVFGKGLLGRIDLDQEIADCCEQLFADRAAEKRRH